jgi:hypothetical protein
MVCKLSSTILLQSECTFNGAWGGSKVPAVFYISSYFWDRAQDVGLIPNDKVRRCSRYPPTCCVCCGACWQGCWNAGWQCPESGCTALIA